MISARFQRLGGEFFWIGLGQAAAALGGIVGVRLLTGVLPPAAYGELALGMTVAALVQQTVLLPLSNASLRFFSVSQETHQLRAYFQGTRRLLLEATVLLVAPAGLLCLVLWALHLGRWLALAVSASTFAVLSGFSAVVSGMQNAARQRVVVAWHDGLVVWSRFAAAVVLVRLLGPFSTFAMWGYALASVLILGSQLWFFRSRILVLGAGEPKPAPTDLARWRRRMFAYAWPFGATGIFAWIQLSSDRWALQAFTSSSTVGLYSVLYQIGYHPINLAASLVTQVVSPVLFSGAGDGSDPMRMESVLRWTNRLVLATIGLTGFGTLVASLLHAPIFSLFVATEYHAVSSLLPWMVLAAGVFASGQLAVLLLLSGMDTRSLLVQRIAGGILGLILNLVGARWLGLQGVVLANVVFSFFYLAWILSLQRVLLSRVARGKQVANALSQKFDTRRD